MSKKTSITRDYRLRLDPPSGKRLERLQEKLSDHSGGIISKSAVMRQALTTYASIWNVEEASR